MFGILETPLQTLQLYLSLLSHTYINASLIIQTFTPQLIGNPSKRFVRQCVAYNYNLPRPIFTFTMIPNSGCGPLSINFPTVLGACYL